MYKGKERMVSNGEATPSSNTATRQYSKSSGIEIKIPATVSGRKTKNQTTLHFVYHLKPPDKNSGRYGKTHIIKNILAPFYFLKAQLTFIINTKIITS
jgi:hypothetical protein